MPGRIRVVAIPIQDQWQHWCVFCADDIAIYEIVLNSVVDARLCTKCITELYRAIGDKI